MCVMRLSPLALNEILLGGWRNKMKRPIVALMIMVLFSAPVFAKSKCGYSKGDSVTESGKYLWADSCEMHGNVEAVNKTCTKIKVSVTKVTAAFGMTVDARCRYDGGEAAAGDTVWMSVNSK